MYLTSGTGQSGKNTQSLRFKLLIKFFLYFWKLPENTPFNIFFLRVKITVAEKL